MIALKLTHISSLQERLFAKHMARTSLLLRFINMSNFKVLSNQFHDKPSGSK